MAGRDLTGRVVVVTGASGGVGRATARAFASQGAKLALVARGEDGLAAALAEVSELGPIDVWVNDAFSSVFARFGDITAEEFRRITEVSYLGYVYGTMAALRRMRSRDDGVIVQVGSALAYRGIPLQSAYCGAKHAIQGFHESLRCELLHDRSGVRVTMVQLPAVNTPQFSWVLSRLPRRPQPVPPIYQPEVAARAIVHASRYPARREYWVGGSTVATLLANAVAPGLLDRYLARTGIDSQQTTEPQSREAPANLWQPADSTHGHDFGAHGRFDSRAHTSSAQLWASQHHGVSLLAAAVAVGVAAVAVGRRA